MVRTGTDERPPAVRSAKTNGRRMFVAGGDARSPWSRRRRDLELLYADDLGGASRLTAFQAGLIETAATLRVALESFESELSEGLDVDIDQYSRIAGHYRRICETLGIERASRDVTPLSDYLAAKAEVSPR